jgi:glycosyltransferase involved in cell wall biosynthesis
MPPRPEAPGAIPLVLHALLTGLRTRNDITLITTVGDAPGELDATEELRRSGLVVHAVDRRQPIGFARQRRRLRLAATWARGAYPWRTVWFADPAIQTTLDRLVGTQPFDVVAVEDNSMGVLRLPPHVASVLTEHEVRAPQPADGQPSPPGHRARRTVQALDQYRWRSYQSDVWRKFDRVQVFTDLDARLVGDMAPEVVERVRVNPFGIAMPSPANPEREAPDTLLFAGDFTHPPNVDAAVWLATAIMPRIRARHPAAKLKVVGANAPKQVLALAGNDIDVVGAVPVMAPIFESASLVLAPVRQGGGMRMKVLHALASGKAVVTTRLGAEGLLLEDKEPALVVADDTDTIAATAARLLDDGTERRALGDRARRFVQAHHSPQAYADRLEAVYEEAIAEREDSEKRQR